MRKWALTAVVLGGCYSPDVALGIPCSDSRECPEGQECDLLASVCTLPSEQLVWRDDTAEDFAAPGAVLEDATIEAAGFVGPVGYLVGGARIAGIQAHLIPDPATTTWADVSAGTITGRGFTRSARVDFGTRTPAELGLTVGDDVTVLVELEAYLPTAGDWRFQLTANDQGFLEIASPGGDFARLVSDVNADTIVTWTVTTPGWHRLRGAFADATMALSFDLRVAPPGGGFRSLQVDEIRARADDLTGLSVDGFDNSYMLEYEGTTVSGDNLEATALPSDPYGLAVGSSSWSLRWSGQILIDEEGDYALRLDTNPGHRLWLDGVLVADKYTSTAELTTTPATHLVPGWHDIAIDLLKTGGGDDGRISLTVTAGPVWVGRAIPADHLRPVVGRGARWVANHSGSTQAIADQGTTSKTISVGLPADLTPFAIDVAYAVAHPVLDTLGVVLDPSTGSNVTLASVGSHTGAGSAYRHTSINTSRTGSSFAFEVTDGTLDMMTGTIDFGAVSILYSGGLAPFTTLARYQSAARDLGDVVGLGAMTWAVRQGATVAVRLRTCDDEAACASEPWTDVALGGVPAVAVRRFAQYAVEIASDGDTPTALDWIELAYTARPAP